MLLLSYLPDYFANRTEYTRPSNKITKLPVAISGLIQSDILSFPLEIRHVHHVFSSANR